MLTPQPIRPDFGEKSLASRTVQELQLELFRRSVVSESEAARFMQILLDSQDLWRGFIIDRLGISEGGHWLQPCSMIKLRNIHENYWNADTVFILCPSQDAARALAARFPPEQFAAMVDIKEDPKEVDRALGGGDAGTAILRAWWD